MPSKSTHTHGHTRARARLRKKLLACGVPRFRQALTRHCRAWAGDAASVKAGGEAVGFLVEGACLFGRKRGVCFWLERVSEFATDGV